MLVSTGDPAPGNSRRRLLKVGPQLGVSVHGVVGTLSEAFPA
jgi:hypothetical protein